MKVVIMLQGSGPSRFFRKAQEELPEELRGDLSLTFADTNELDRAEHIESFAKWFGEPDFFLLDIRGGLPYFKRFEAFWRETAGKIPVFVRSDIEEENRFLKKECGISPLFYEKIMEYLEMGGTENLKSVLLLLLREFGGHDGIAVPPPAVLRRDGLYGLPPGVGEEAYLAQAANQKDTVVVGILMHFYSLRQEDTERFDALIGAVRKYGAFPLAVYTNMMPADDGYEGLRGAMRRYLMRDGKPLVDVLINCSGHSLTALASPGSGKEYSRESVLEELDVPVLQAFSTFYTRAQWEESAAGIDPMLLCSCIYQPEFDGQIIAAPIACTEQELTDYGVKARTVPIQERVEKTVRLAINWGKLRRTPPEQKKVAIVLHNMPPRADMIGRAYGLDTPESVFGMYQSLKTMGISLDYDFADGQEIIRRITEGTTNDGRFLSEEEMLSRCESVVDQRRYGAWFAKLPAKVRREMERDWGEAPGEFMAVDGKLLIPGIHNGNLFIGLQPPRAPEEEAEESYHSADLVCPHQYLAFYRYLKEVFGADLIVHVGTHGTIEWLPGKQTGLSGECYPDLAIAEIPHIYPYIIDAPGEGVQAKRRTSAVILEHCIPSMTESGLYGELEGLQELSDAYFRAENSDPGKLPDLAGKIWEGMLSSGIQKDLSLSEEQFREDPRKAIERLHVWISDIRGTQIRDGLHIFGKVPEGERFWNLARMLVSAPNGEIPSLLQAVAGEAGEDLERLLEQPGQLRDDGRTNAMVLEELKRKGKRYLEELAACLEISGVETTEKHAEPSGAETAEKHAEPSGTEAAEKHAEPSGAEAAEQYCESLPDQLRACMKFVLDAVVPGLRGVREELTFFERAVEGRFVPPGPSGSPTRGGARLLPTGRNFYTVDPTAIPSRSSWETGKLLGDQLLQKFLEEEGKYPESVAIVVYGGETMRTRGDDIAEILYLYGVRPVWLGATDRVIALEAIPEKELRRPRIDVTLRITGLFRDTFPNLIERIEDAVNLVASLPEPEETNYVRKHIRKELEEFLAQGIGREQAYERASLRVFGCPPGNYGAGMDVLVNSRKWESTEDFGRAYLKWSSHGYSRKLHGESVQELFARRLQGCEATVKNISTFESDMLDSDDFYNYHGGMISAVKTLSGKNPRSYSTSAADPAHVRTRSVEEETARIVRARIANPRWREGMMRHGYRGAQEFSAMVDILFGWDATSGVVQDWMYETIARDYLLDEEMRDWMEQANPFAVHAISERLLEATRRGMWEADRETLAQLEEIYLSIDGDMEDI